MGIFDKKTGETEVKEPVVNEAPKIKRKQVELSDEDMKKKGEMAYSPLSHEIICRKHGVALEGWEEIESDVRIKNASFDGTMRRAAVYRKEKNGRTFLCIPKDWSKEPPLESPRSKMITASKMRGN